MEVECLMATQTPSRAGDTRNARSGFAVLQETFSSDGAICAVYRSANFPKSSM